jgi:peroxiredoxin
MVRMETPICDFGWKAPDFALPSVDGKTYSLAEVAGSNGLLVMFICNHCPYVKAVIERIVRDVAELKTLGIGAVAIMSNDASEYPEDSFDNMRALSEQLAFPMPYLLDATQEVAKAFGTVCTPDFFGFNRNLELQYRGRLDASRKEAAPTDARRELFEAMQLVARTQHGPTEQIPSMGCSIKWLTDANG